MSARAAVRALLVADPDLLAAGVQEIYPANAVDTPAEECFLILTWADAGKAYGRTGAEGLTVWVHDRNRDYGRIDQVLDRAAEVLTAATHVVGEDGWTLTLAEWAGEGPDLYDDGYNTCTRYADFTVVSRRSA